MNANTKQEWINQIHNYLFEKSKIIGSYKDNLESISIRLEIFEIKSNLYNAIDNGVADDYLIIYSSYLINKLKLKKEKRNENNRVFI